MPWTDDPEAESQDPTWGRPVSGAGAGGADSAPTGCLPRTRGALFQCRSHQVRGNQADNGIRVEDTRALQLQSDGRAALGLQLAPRPDMVVREGAVIDVAVLFEPGEQLIDQAQLDTFAGHPRAMRFR